MNFVIDVPDKFLNTLFIAMMTNEEDVLYYSMENKNIVNVSRDEIIPAIHHRIPRVEVEAFCETIKGQSQHIDQFNNFLDEFVEVQKENNVGTNLLFNEYLYNIFLNQLSDWCDDTGTKTSIISLLIGNVGIDLVLDFLATVK